MAKQERVEKSRSTSKRQKEVSLETPEKIDTKALTDEMDDILEEIDSVLEKNAEQFVRDYVQKGGE